MMLPGKLGTMMKKAQEMQENMQKMQAELANRHIVGIAGAGAVKVTLNGHYACQRVELTEEALKEDKDMLEALLAAAISDASAKVNAMTQEEMANLTGGMGLPGGEVRHFFLGHGVDFGAGFSPSFDQLVQALTCLPGVGNKTAQRMALRLLLDQPQKAKQLADAIDHALHTAQRCHKCRNISDADLCLICANPKRDASTLCVVEAPADVLAIEQSTDYRGQYFVLMGHISPLDGIGPIELGMDILDRQLATGDIKELVLATNSTLEGETTAYFLAELAAKHNVPATRLAHGVPMGGELAYIDKSTLSLAFNTRSPYRSE